MALNHVTRLRKIGLIAHAFPYVLARAGLILALGVGCNSSEKPKNRFDGLDGGYVQREECSAPSMNCHYDCVRRDASLGCTGCCLDQRFLCDTGQQHSFDHCKDAK